MTLSTAIGFFLVLCTGLYAAVFLVLRTGIRRVLRASAADRKDPQGARDSGTLPVLAHGENPAFVFDRPETSAVWRRTGPPSGRDDSVSVGMTADTDEIDREVTIIVAAHNEAGNVPLLLQAIASQSYPLHHIRLILAEDRSTDGTADAARAALEELKDHATSSDGSVSAAILRIDSVPDGIAPKKHALHRAIEQAETELLLFTDADCVPGPRWVESMMAEFNRGADVVIGLSPTLGGRTFSGMLSMYDTVRTAAFALGALGWGRPYMAVGRNWGFRKSVYERSGGLPPLYHHLGGDDDLLFQQLRAHGTRVAAVAVQGSLCPTRVPGSFRAFVRQKLRHYRVSGYYDLSSRFPLGFATAAGVLGLIAAPVWLVCSGMLHPALSLAMLLLGASVAGWCMRPLRRIMVAGATGRMLAALTVFLEPAHVVFSSVVGSLSFMLTPRW